MKRELLSKATALMTSMLFMLSIPLLAQTYNHSATNQTTCSGTFYDHNGTLNYQNNRNITQTFFPSTAGAKLRFTFTTFATEDDYDGLVIYNGNSTAAPIISSGLPVGLNATTAPAGSFYGTVSPGTVTSTAADGSLTFVFRSDAATVAAGWVATIQCITNEISTNAASFGPFCNDDDNNVTLTYTTIGTFTGNYRVQISSAAGVFPSNTTSNLLSTVSSGTGTITATIPSGTATGSGYRVRVVNTAPSTTSVTDNGSAIVINPSPSLTLSTTSATICVGAIQAVTATVSPTTTTATIGTGTQLNTAGTTSGGDATGYPAPYGGNYENTRQQYLIRASELTAAGVVPGNITSITFDVTTLGSVGTLNNYAISIGNTTQTAIASWETGLTSVFGPASYTPVAGANTHNFSTPFVWNGTSNIIVQICHSNDATNSGTFFTVNAISKYTNTSFNSSLTFRQDNAVACTSTSISYTEAQRPNMVFGVAMPITWSPATNLFTNAAATTAYVAGSSAATVYAKPTASITYTASATLGSCTTTANVAMTVTPVSAGGTVSAAATVCSGANSGTLNLTGHTGDVIRWESSTNGFTTVTTIANTTTSLTYTNITATTAYRAVVQSGSCASANSTAVTITVNPATVGGTVGTSATVCATSNSGTLNLTGHVGTILRWESSTDGFATVTNIANTGTSQSYTNLAVTTSYRAVVQSGVCATANSAAATITVNAASAGGTVSSSATVCSGASGTLNLSGHTGNVIRWESSTDGFATANTIANTTTSLTYTDIAITTAYRAVVQSGVCAAANSTVATITVNAASAGGTVSAPATVCSGTNSGTLTLSGHTGNVVRWESSTDNFATVTNITNTTTSLTYNNITATTAYRAVVQSGSCATANSTAVTITVTPVSVGGSVSAPATVCSGTNSGTLTLSGHTGNVVRWESSTDNFATVTNIANTTTSLTYTNITATTAYRAVVQSGSCATANSTAATITVSTAATGGTLSGDATICYGNGSGTLTLSGQSGTIVGWESSLNNFATAGTPIANTTTTLSYSNLTNTTYYRVVLSGGACGAAYSTVAVVTVNVNNIWTGAVNTNWHETGNWSCGVVPTSDVNVTITAVTNQPVIGADAFARTLTMDTATTLLLQSGYDFRVVDAINGMGTSAITIENNANLIQELDVNNNGTATVKRNTNPLMRLDYTLWSSPVTGSQTLLQFSPQTTANRFYIYNPVTNLYNVTATSNTFTEGTGYLIRIRNNHPATTPTVWQGSFIGTLNNGAVDIPVTNGTYNAIGNPYPSTVDANQFIINNGINEALYFWRKTNDDTTTSYATYTLAGGAGTSANPVDPLGLVPNGVIQVGQGFIAKATSSNLHFDNTMRIGNNANQFFRMNQPAVERNRMWLNLTSTTGIFSQTMVAYMTGATYGVDEAIDGPYFNDSQTALTSLIGANEYAVQGRTLPFEQTDVVPLGFKVTDAGSFSIGIDHVDGFFTDPSQPLFLRDNTTGEEFDLRSGVYSFASEAGVFNERFEVIYQQTLATTTPLFDENSVVVYKQEQDIVINTGKVRMDQVQIYDVRGRLITKKDKINALETKIFAGTTNQVLIVKITDVNGNQVTKKVVN